jgi:hypothetical protein
VGQHFLRGMTEILHRNLFYTSRMTRKSGRYAIESALTHVEKNEVRRPVAWGHWKECVKLTSWSENFLDEQANV